MDKIAPTPFFTEWKGHPIADLKKFFTNTLLLRDAAPIVWLAGDSSLDNKAWIPADGPGGTKLPVSVPDIYTPQFRALTPFKPDVAFWMNHMFGERATCINGAIEASLLRERGSGALLPHDRFVRDNIREQDVLVVSVGANDIALSPTMCTAFNMLRLAHLSSLASIEDGTAWALSHFRRLFGKEVQRYIERLTSTTKPAAVVVCMIYQPLESGLCPEKSWADNQLRALKYDSQPQKLQAAIRTMYKQATEKIVVKGVPVVPLPLFEVMDGKDADDYVERVEPSVEGGRKMSEAIRKAVLGVLDGEKPRETREDSVQKDGTVGALA
jgi:lysophospholipase L1-like esterase